MARVGLTYGTNAVPAGGGTTDSSRIRFQNAAVPMPGSGASLPTKAPVVEEHLGCAGTTKSGGNCKARPAKGTEWCIGHLRSMGEI
jgi:hypothetical protein